MPANSVRSFSTAKSTKTAKTVDDVLEMMDEELPRQCSLQESRKFIINRTDGNMQLADDCLKVLQDLMQFFAPVSLDPKALLDIMLRYEIILGGIQATSFFYPLCELFDAPWDFFHKNSGNDMVEQDIISTLTGLCGLNKIESVSSDNKLMVIYFTITIKNSRKPTNVRLFISNEPPIASILEYRHSYNQSFISPSIAVCFWPRLNERGLYRVFDRNTDLDRYPVGTTVFETSMKSMRKAKPRAPQPIPNVHYGMDTRIEYTKMENVCDFDTATFGITYNYYTNIVYAIYNSTTRFVGTVYGMN